MPIIGGERGPFQNVPGAYGGNTAIQVQQKLATLQGRVDATSSTIRFTPAQSFQQGQLSNAGLADYFRYAEQDIKQFDSPQNGGNGNGLLEHSEAVQAFNGDVAQADQFMKAVDQDGQPGISPVDMTAYELAQDAPKQLYANLGLDSVFDLAQQQTQDNYQKFYPGETVPPMAWDGQATPAERQVVDKMIGQKNLNTIAGVGMRNLQQTLGLSAQYEAYKSSPQ